MKKNISRLWNYKIYIRIIVICITQITCGYISAFIGQGVYQQISQYIFYLFSYLMLLHIAIFIICRIILLRKAKPIRKNQDVSYADFPEFLKLARNIHLKLKKQPFLIIKNLENIGANPLTKQIILGENLLDKLEYNEKLAVIAHELAHLKRKHIWILAILWLIIVFSIGYTLPDEFYTESVMIVISSLFMFYVFLSHQFEYDADKIASKYTDRNDVISAIKKTTIADKWNLQSEDHPSTIQRIQKLKKSALHHQNNPS